MDATTATEINPFAVFEVRLDKDRGILVLTIRKDEHDEVCFFRYHHQPIEQHPKQIQQIVRAKKVTVKTKSIKVNMLQVVPHYWNVAGHYFEFKGITLNSTVQQTAMVQNMKINREIGSIKRKATIKESPVTKTQEIYEKIQQDEAQFQAERAKRIAELMQP